MLINEQNVELAFRGFKATFDEGALEAENYADKIAMTIPSSTREEQYGWLGAMPNMREWIGPRHVNSLQAHGFTLRNIDFESTIEVKRNDLEDDQVGVYGPAFRMMGQQAKTHPEQLIWPLLKSGFGLWQTAFGSKAALTPENWLCCTNRLSVRVPLSPDGLIPWLQ